MRVYVEKRSSTSTQKDKELGSPFFNAFLGWHQSLVITSNLRLESHMCHLWEFREEPPHYYILNSKPSLSNYTGSAQIYNTSLRSFIAFFQILSYHYYNDNNTHNYCIHMRILRWLDSFNSNRAYPKKTGPPGCPDAHPCHIFPGPGWFRLLANPSPSSLMFSFLLTSADSGIFFIPCGNHKNTILHARTNHIQEIIGTAEPKSCGRLLILLHLLNKRLGSLPGQWY